MDRAELAARTGLSPATLSRAVAELRRAGFVQEAATPAGGPGRPKRQAELRPGAAHVVGIDAGGSMLRAVLADLDGQILRRVARPAADARDTELLVADLVELVRSTADQPTIRLIGIAAGISGIVDHDHGAVRMSPDLPGLDGVTVAARLEDALSVAVRIDNDDVLAAIGEAAVGAARGARDVVFLSLGYGLGAGVLVDGSPLRGASQAAGAVGFMGAQPLDELGSGRAIAERYAAALARGGPPKGRPAARPVDARGVFERARSGDQVARRVVTDAVAAIAEMAVNVAAVVDPEVIVLGGGLAAAPEIVEAVTNRLQATLPFPPRVVHSALADAAVVHGAVALALAHGPLQLSSRTPAPGVADESVDASPVPILAAPLRTT